MSPGSQAGRAGKVRAQLGELIMTTETTHQAWIEDGRVALANMDDDDYVEIFETPEDLENFIKMLRRVAQKVWG